MEPAPAIQIPPPPPPPWAGVDTDRDTTPPLHGFGWLHRTLGVTVSTGARDRLRPLVLGALGVVGIGSTLAVLGQSPSILPIELHPFGMVCPACGLTRGTVATLRGHVGLAVRYNPLSPLVPAAAMGLLIRTIVGALAGRWVNVRFRPTRVAWVLGTAAVATLWAWQTSRAEFVRHATSI